MSTFDYVKYDELAIAVQANLKRQFEGIEATIQTLDNGRAKSLAITKLEEAYMWCGKAIRDEQITRNKFTQKQEERAHI